MISLMGIKELSLNDTPFGRDPNVAMMKFQLQYSVTLYYQDTNLKGHSGFFGRTYISEKKDLKISATAGDKLDSDTEDFIYLQTSNKDDKYMMVVELIVSKQAD